jgi:hypothetical protein
VAPFDHSHVHLIFFVSHALLFFAAALPTLVDLSFTIALKFALAFACLAVAISINPPYVILLAFWCCSTSFFVSDLSFHIIQIVVAPGRKNLVPSDIRLAQRITPWISKRKDGLGHAVTHFLFCEVGFAIVKLVYDAMELSSDDNLLRSY